MRKVNCWVATLFSLCVALSQAKGIAQEVQNKLEPRVLYEREFLNTPLGVNAIFKGILNRRGTELLLNDTANTQIIAVDTTTFAETKIPLTLPALELQTDSETDKLFLETYRPHDDDAFSDLTCYEQLSALKNRQPQWSFAGLWMYKEIRWLKEHQRFIVFDNWHRVDPQTVVLLDKDGIMLAEAKIKGEIAGVDETAEGFSIFHWEKKGGTCQVTQTLLDDDFNVSQVQPLPIVDRAENVRGSYLGISRSFRLRELKSGEVTKYFQNIATQPGYLDMSRQLPFENLPTRISNDNKLSAAESPGQPEIIVHPNRRATAGSGFILFDQQSTYFYEPNQYLTDAMFDDGRKLIVTSGASAKPRYYKVQLISFE